MPPKGGNAKKESGRAKKEANEVAKKQMAAVDRERQEARKWEEGARVDKGADAKAKQEAAAAKKAEAARLLAEEEANIASSSKAKAPKAAKPVKKTVPAPSPSNVAETSGKGKARDEEPAPAPGTSSNVYELAESFSASNLDDALDLLDVVNAKTDKESVGNMASGLEKHPERRFKAAFEAYMERELPELKKDRPGLRLQQYKEVLFKSFQKSPDNPFNQTTVSYDASKEEKIDALKKRQDEIQERLREKKGMGSP